MRILGKDVQEYKGDFADFGYNLNGNDDKTFEINKSSSSSLSSSPSPLSPLLPVQTVARRSYSSGRFSLEPIKLTILKLDGSSFDITVTKKATVAKVKQAVEAAFSHLPKQGHGKVLWPHVWGQFCLCFEGQKLLHDRDSIGFYRIQNGDQLEFVRHTPADYNLAIERLENHDSDPEEYEASPSKAYSYEDLQKHDVNYHKYNQQNLDENEEEGYEDVGVKMKCRLPHIVRGLFSYRKLETPNISYIEMGISDSPNLAHGFTKS